MGLYNYCMAGVKMTFSLHSREQGDLKLRDLTLTAFLIQKNDSIQKNNSIQKDNKIKSLSVLCY